MTKKDYKAAIVAEVMHLMRCKEINTATTNKDVLGMLTRENDDIDDIYTFTNHEISIIHNSLRTDNAYMQYEGDEDFENILHRI